MKSNNIPSVMNLESSTANIDHSKAISIFTLFFMIHPPSQILSICQLRIHDSLNFITITVTDIYEALVSLDVKKSPGMDKISPRVLQSCAVALCEPLCHLFSQSLRYAVLPSS